VAVFAIRNVQLSVNKRITDVFTTPPNDPTTGTPYIATSFNVYTEDNYQNRSFAPTFPFIFLLMSRIPPIKTRLPCIIEDFQEFPNAAYELGTRRGMLPTVALHIFGKNRGERDDLAGFIRQVLTDYPAITIYDWSNITNPVSKYTVIAEDISVQTQTIAPDTEAREGSLNNWIVVSFSLPFLRE
jgi:hypothetical protein